MKRDHFQVGKEEYPAYKCPICQWSWHSDPHLCIDAEWRTRQGLRVTAKGIADT